MKLYYSPGACSLAVNIVLNELGLDFDLVKVNLREKTLENGDDFYKISAKGQVPTLELDDGVILTEGVAITQFLADSHPDAGLAPKAPSEQRAQLVGVLNYIAAEFHKSFGPLFNPTASDEVKEFARNVLKTKIDYVNNELEDKNFIYGDSFTIADAYLFTTSRWINAVGLKLSDWKNLAAYEKALRDRPSVYAAMKAEGLVK